MSSSTPSPHHLEKDLVANLQRGQCSSQSFLGLSSNSCNGLPAHFISVQWLHTWAGVTLPEVFDAALAILCALQKNVGRQISIGWLSLRSNDEQEPGFNGCMRCSTCITEVVWPLDYDWFDDVQGIQPDLPLSKP